MTKPRILIVEDDAATAGGFKNILLSFGYVVTGIASTRDEAILFAQQETPDLVLMDIMLGDEPGGIEAANEIRSRHNTPIIFLTSFVDDEILARAKISDPFGYLLKPCHPRELFATIELALFKHAGIVQREAMEEERRRSGEHLQREHTFRRAIEDSVPSGIATFDLEGVQTYVNQAFCRMVGWTEGELVGASAPFMYWPPEETKAVSVAFKKMLDGSIIEKGFELRFQRRSGERFYAFVVVTPLRNVEGSVEGWLVSVTDIDDRKRTEHQLEESRTVLERRVMERTSELAQANEELRKRDIQLSTAQQIAHLGSWEWDIQTSKVIWSEELYSIYGLQPGDFAGTFESFLQFVHPEDREATSTCIQDAVRNRGPFDFEERVVRLDGSTRVLQTQGRVVFDEHGEVAKLAGVCVDVTEQKRLQERLAAAERKRFADLRRYASSVQRAQEEERQRIARELHDDLCQRLSGMKLNVEVMADEARAGDKTMHRRLQSFNKQCEELIADVRRMSVNLRPTVLDDFGLIIALGLLTREFEKLHKMPITLKTDASSRMHLEPQVEIALYRIAQEALSNVAKHAQASRVTLELHKNAENVILRICDDGKGFSPAETATRKDVHSGLGLISMRERTELFGGSFTVESEPGRGTTIMITIPLTIETKHEENALAHR